MSTTNLLQAFDNAVVGGFTCAIERAIASDGLKPGVNGFHHLTVEMLTMEELYEDFYRIKAHLKELIKFGAVNTFSLVLAKANITCDVTLAWLMRKSLTKPSHLFLGFFDAIDKAASNSGYSFEVAMLDIIITAGDNASDLLVPAFRHVKHILARRWNGRAEDFLVFLISNCRRRNTPIAPKMMAALLSLTSGM